MAPHLFKEVLLAGSNDWRAGFGCCGWLEDDIGFNAFGRIGSCCLLLVRVCGVGLREVLHLQNCWGSWGIGKLVANVNGRKVGADGV
ncbi:hypothetical protein PsAD2_02954 [Pseudovibrio axinellae]|uniref:Uncharacterized protein n=1 Tax=Pseudovibrio axinellae TaxID=989403 RepID=A0A165XE22_9HYPH|nr:hypothetical protein [Pseudovibrio axinellae]KZL17618.1 hypothetical protein PsAD2_02954 [Pseudovibrio axinellae]SER46086.1 hypothetical protein SAMN05421798_110128 [Pseudovibrio axinellae]